MVGILSSSLTVGTELSKPFAKYLSVSIVWSCRGTLRLVTSAPRLRFAFRKASAAVTLVSRLKCSDCPSSSHSPSLYPLGFRPVAQLHLHPPPPSHPPQLAPYCSPPGVDLRSLYKNPPRLRPSSWPSLMPLWHTLRRPLTRVTSIHHPILPSGTASSPGTTPVCSSILSHPSSG